MTEKFERFVRIDVSKQTLQVCVLLIPCSAVSENSPSGHLELRQYLALVDRSSWCWNRPEVAEMEPLCAVAGGIPRRRGESSADLRFPVGRQKPPTDIPDAADSAAQTYVHRCDRFPDEESQQPNRWWSGGRQPAGNEGGRTGAQTPRQWVGCGVDELVGLRICLHRLTSWMTSYRSLWNRILRGTNTMRFCKA